MLRHVDLCSGIGGFALGFEWAGLSQPILFCDTEAWCRKILKQHWPDVPITEDVKELANEPDGVPDCDIITAGYPCQPFSVAGKQEGTKDDRHIWPYISQIVAHKRPTWVVLENVYGHIALGLDQVLFDLEAEGYTSRTFVVPACGVNAPHRRDRLFVMGYTDLLGNPSGGRLRGVDRRRAGQKPSDGCSDVADTNPSGLQGDVRQGQTGTQGQSNRHASERSEGVTEPRLGGMVDGLSVWMDEPEDIPRVATGVPDRTHRIKGLGNAIVPQIALQIGLSIKAVEDKKAEV